MKPFIFAALLLTACNPGPISSPPPTKLVEVEIVDVRDQDGWAGWGDAGCTTVQYPDGTRIRHCGRLGKVGDHFKMRVPAD